MDFETVKQAALRLGCTERAVQKWAKMGKIPYAYKDGRDWKIPANAVKPNEACAENQEYLNEPYPIIHKYKYGEVLEYIDSISNYDDKQMALSEYYYFTGEFKKSCIITEPYLTSDNPMLSTVASIFNLFSNLAQGHITKTYYAGENMRNLFEIYSAQDQSQEVKTIAIFSSAILKTQLHLPQGEVPEMIGVMKYLDEGLRLFACYLAAYNEYFKKDFSKSLGIAEAALNLSVDLYPIPIIYINLISAIDFINLRQEEKAVEYVEKAWELAEKDGFIMPFVEHYSLMQGLIERYFKKAHPNAYTRITAIAKAYNEAWYHIYNVKNENTVATSLSQIEFTVAMLYSRNWRAKEIAAHLDLSERTIMNYITIVYDKLGINGKKELEKFMLK